MKVIIDLEIDKEVVMEIIEDKEGTKETIEGTLEGNQTLITISKEIEVLREKITRNFSLQIFLLRLENMI